MRRLILPVLAALLCAGPASAAEEKKSLRQVAVEQFGEIIALISICQQVTVNMPVMSVIAIRAGLDLDDILDEAGAYSTTLMPKMLESGGVEGACNAAAIWYGPRGSKVRNLLVPK